MTNAQGGSQQRPALARCIRIPTDQFAADFWGTSALLSPAASLPRDFTDLLTPDAVDELLADRALRTPFIRMAKEGSVLAPSRYTAPGGFGADVADQVDSDKVLTEFAAGATIVLQGLHRTWSPLRDFARQLVTDIGHPVQINAYITPGSNRGFDPHYDTHDVFVLQISGEKRWVIHQPVHENPFTDEPWGQRSDEVAARAAEAPAIDTVLRPGDALYLPRGWIHSATALGGTTVHVTVGMSAFTRSDLARELVARAVRSDELRRSLPLGIDVRDAGQLAADIDFAAKLLVESLSADTGDDGQRVASDLGGRFTSMIRPEPVHPLRTVARVQSLQPDDRVRWRDGLRAAVSANTDGATIRLADRVLRLPAECGTAVTGLPRAGVLAAGELPGLDQSDSLTVSRRLLREGILVAVR